MELKCEFQHPATSGGATHTCDHCNKKICSSLHLTTTRIGKLDLCPDCSFALDAEIMVVTNRFMQTDPIVKIKVVAKPPADDVVSNGGKSCPSHGKYCPDAH